MQNVVEEYMFFSKADADLAEKEAEKVKKLEEKLADNRDVNLLYKLYNKCIETRSFKTPIGLDFMRKLKHELETYDNLPGEILPIPLFSTYDNSVYERGQEAKPAMKMQSKEQEKERKKEGLKISVFLNILLIAVIIAMFVILSTSDRPNIINYENAIVNKYASWEEELNQREEDVREKEAQLDITP